MKGNPFHPHTVEYHQWERCVMEGVAPSPELRKIIEACNDVQVERNLRNAVKRKNGTSA